MNDYKSAFNAAAADISAIIALLGFTKYPGVDPVLRAIADLILEKAENQVLREERDAANKRADTLEHRMMGMMTRHFAEAWRNRDTQKALDGYLSAGIAQLEQERDAAQARVAELTATRNRYGLDAHYFNKNLQRILRDFESFTPDELARSLIILAKVADEKVVAQAQHSVPEGWMLVECGIWTQEQVDEMQKTVARFRNSEFVDDRALAMAVADAGQCKAPEISLAELLAAAPGKEGL
ncbi:hypothetical protein IPC618_08035 [Pseudomonas aeruginosa]|uniref:hypothetical protein n=2 Tax=Pseudomonas aeruginosa TaxID=287 RepID=UPI00022F2B2A|nr:hypothetical protein [Pseudomonas aeruginosa]AMX89752.1 hypothetical protein A4W92_22975 [Pseudomonas aeruginosa]ANT74940.1 hypothetical protein ACG06_06370 [Pseudomonas aeruginosa]EIU3463798.1 hypothetical protein [Pseudomonas aeruginosa]EKQ6365198.1 hypothetical protein [Pseudomonas aeruginosa]EKS3058074.1 hypothetical protein [Pseudomonas aeruginosa]